MNVMAVAAVGVAIVLLTILWLRLHPLLGLLIGALFVFAATPPEVQLENAATESGHLIEITEVSSDGRIGLRQAVTAKERTYHVSDQVFSVAASTTSGFSLTPVDKVDAPAIAADTETQADQLVWYRPSETSVALVPGTSLVATEAIKDFQRSRWTGLGGKLADGFAKTFRKLGIPVTMAAIVGVCLLESGAASRLVTAILALFGPRGTAPALTASGFILGVPVFFDNVFYLLLPLAKAVGRQRPERYLAAVMAIIVGATMAHSLVPPTPGPLLVAAATGVNVGLMMLGGMVVGLCSVSVGFTYGMLCSRFIKLTPSESSSDEPVAQQANPRMPLMLAAVPIAVPILALGGTEILEYFTQDMPAGALPARIHSSLILLNDPGLIFIGTAILSIALLRAYSSRETVGRSVSRGISDAGTIVLLTCAGGAFGASLQQLQLAQAIGQHFEGLTTPWGVLLTAFFLTAIIRVAQGSATVAMITSAAIVAPVMQSINLPFHPLYVALAIGCGSKPLPWMNDSGFWQVATMTGLTTTQTLKTFSVALTLMGITGFAVTLLGAWLLPLV